MGLFKNINNALSGMSVGWGLQKQVEKDLSWADQLRLFRADKSKDSVFDKLSTKEQLKTIENNAIVYACVTTKANAFQQPPLVIEEYNEASETWKSTDKHDFLLPFQFNPDLSESELKQYMALHIDLTGKSYLWEWSDALGNTRELWPIPPSWATPVLVEALSGDSKEARLIKEFQIKPDTNKANEWIIPVEDMAYTKYTHPSKLWDGLSPLLAAGKNVQLDNKGDEYKGETMDALRVPGVVVKTKKPLNQRQKDDLRAVLRQKIGGDAKENALMISGDDAAVELLNPMESFDWATYTELNETRICMVFGVPPIVIGSWVGLKNSPWSNTAEAKRWLYQNTMVGMWGMFSSSLTRALIPEDQWGKLRFAFDLKGVKELRDDIDQLWGRARNGFNDGILTRAEAREMIDVDVTDNDKVFKYAMNTVLISSESEDGGELGIVDPALTEEEQDEGIAAMENGEL